MDTLIQVIKAYPYAAIGFLCIALALGAKIKIGSDYLGLELGIHESLRMSILCFGIFMLFIESILNFNVIIPNLGTSINNFYVQVTSSFNRPQNTLTNDDALILIKNYLAAKELALGKLYDIENAKQFTTGNAYSNLIGCKEIECKNSVEWLKSNNAYIKFGVQKIYEPPSNININPEPFNELSLKVETSGYYLIVQQNSKMYIRETPQKYCEINVYKFKSENSKTWKVSNIENEKDCALP